MESRWKSTYVESKRKRERERERDEHPGNPGSGQTKKSQKKTRNDIIKRIESFHEYLEKAGRERAVVTDNVFGHATIALVS
jgi:hypothetical protein